MQINTEQLDFRKYHDKFELEADEMRDLFPPCFIINLTCEDPGHKLYAEYRISCIGKNNNLIFKDLLFNVYVPAKRSKVEASSHLVKSK